MFVILLTIEFFPTLGCELLFLSVFPGPAVRLPGTPECRDCGDAVRDEEQAAKGHGCG